MLMKTTQMYVELRETSSITPSSLFSAAAALLLRCTEFNGRRLPVKTMNIDYNVIHVLDTFFNTQYTNAGANFGV